MCVYIYIYILLLCVAVATYYQLSHCFLFVTAWFSVDTSGETLTWITLVCSVVFKNWLQFCYNIHHYSITSSMKGHLHKNSFKTNNFEKFSVTASTIYSWNKMKDWMGETTLKNLRSSKTKWLFTETFI